MGTVDESEQTKQDDSREDEEESKKKDAKDINASDRSKEIETKLNDGVEKSEISIINQGSKGDENKSEIKNIEEHRGEYLEKEKSQEVIVSDEAEIVLRRESLKKEGLKEIIQKDDLNEGIQEKDNSAEDATSTENDKLSRGSKNEGNISDQAMLKKGNEDNITSLEKIDTNNKQEVILPHEMETEDNKEMKGKEEIKKQSNEIDKDIEVREDMKEERAESLTNDTVKEDIIKGVETLSNESLKETELVNKVELSKD